MEYLSLVQGNLGRMKTEYAIALHPEAKPFDISRPRSVHIPLLSGVQQEIQKMEDLGVIERVEHTTLWCAPMVTAKKKNNSLHICVDFVELNNHTVR